MIYFDNKKNIGSDFQFLKLAEKMYEVSKWSKAIRN